MNNRITELLRKASINCEPGREWPLLKCLAGKLTEEGYSELKSLMLEALSEKAVEPKQSQLKQVRMHAKFINDALRKRALEIPLEVDALHGYRKLKGKKEMKPIADYLLDVAVERGHPAAYLEKARLFKAPEQREYWLLRSMHKGCSEAAYRLAHFYRDFGDVERYINLLTKARDMGHAEARFEYIDVFMEETNRNEPVFGQMLHDMERLAKERCHIGAMTKAAFHYGDSTSPYYDLEKALSLWDLSASPDNPESCYYLALYYRKRGEDAELAGDAEEAKKNYFLAMEYAGYGYSKYEPYCGKQLGFTMMDLKWYDESYEVFKALSDRGDGQSTRTLGLFYSKGIGRDIDWEAAMPFFEKAVEQGYTSAEYDIGLSLENLGRTEECVEHHLLALEAGYAFAAKHLALLLEEGEILAKDEELAKKLLGYYEAVTKEDRPFWG